MFTFNIFRVLDDVCCLAYIYLKKYGWNIIIYLNLFINLKVFVLCIPFLKQIFKNINIYIFL